MPRIPDQLRRDRSGEAGFSLVETLIAAAVLLLILIGILPLFERSRLNVMQGNLATKSSNGAVDVSERLLSANFNSFDTNLEDTQFARTITDFWLLEGDTWTDTVPAGDHAYLTRQTTIEQFGVPDLLDGDEDPFETALIGNEPTGNVHLKRFQVEITDARSGGNTPVYRIVTVQTY